MLNIEFFVTTFYLKEKKIKFFFLSVVEKSFKLNEPDNSSRFYYLRKQLLEKPFKINCTIFHNVIFITPNSLFRQK